MHLYYDEVQWNLCIRSVMARQVGVPVVLTLRFRWNADAGLASCRPLSLGLASRSAVPQILAISLVGRALACPEAERSSPSIAL